MDDGISIFGDWGASNNSPRTFISSFFNEDISSRGFVDFADSGKFGFLETENEKTALCYKEEVNKSGLECCSDFLLEPVQLNVCKSSSRGGLSERMAARAGFSALTVNTRRGGTENVISSPSNKVSTCLFLSPGVSPTALLESPVFLSNSMAEPSPTTGKFPFAYNKDSNQFWTLETDISNVRQIEDFRPEAFTFPRLGSNFSFSSLDENKFASSIDQKQPLVNMGASLQQVMEQPSETKESAEDLKADSFLANECSPPDDNQNGETDPKGELSSMSNSAAEDDGYNWRKYGQKQVKGSEFPRSYYKCTFLNCPVKKKVERSLVGHVTEIIYRGAHNHPKPPSSRRSSTSSAHSFEDTQMDNSDYHILNANFDGKIPLINKQSGNGGSEWRGDAMEAVSSASVAEFATSNSIQTHLSSAMSNDEEDGATHGSFSMGCDAEGEEIDSKRRKLDLCPIDMSVASRAMREPRVVVQTTSEIDILDDGYRWRKYGQKVVKGNPNPRSYYKCTNPGCTVRKHVERASHDLKSVITTYEGKHNHDVPATKTNNHQSSNSSNAASTSMQQPHNSLRRRAEPVQESFMRFENHVPIDPFTLPCREPQLGTEAGYGDYALGIGHHDPANLGIGGLGPMRIPAFASINPYLVHQRKADNGGFIVPKGEPKEPILQSDLPVITNAPEGYYQFANRVSLGPYI